jgi:hypothetical protein
MAKNLIDESKKWIKDFYDNGEWKKDPEVRYNGKLINQESVDFLEQFYRFLIESSFLNEATIMWLNSNLSSVRDMVEHYNSQVLEINALNINTAQSAVTYDKRKIGKYFEENMILKVCLYPEDNLEQNQVTLDKLQRLYMNDKEYRDSMVIKLPKDYMNKSLTREDWMRLSNIIERYSKRKIEMIEQGLDSNVTGDMIGYYNYLISSKKLADIDKKRLKQLRIILGLENR